MIQGRCCKRYRFLIYQGTPDISGIILTASDAEASQRFKHLRINACAASGAGFLKERSFYKLFRNWNRKVKRSPLSRNPRPMSGIHARQLCDVHLPVQCMHCACCSEPEHHHDPWPQSRRLSPWSRAEHSAPPAMPNAAICAVRVYSLISWWLSSIPSFPSSRGFSRILHP